MRFRKIPTHLTMTDEMMHSINHGVQVQDRSAQEMLALLTPKRKTESYYQTLTENILNGGHLHIHSVGFTDLTLENAHVEIKHGPMYHVTAGQLLKYHLARPRQFRVAILFGRIPVDINFLREFFSHTIVTHVLYFDDSDNIIPLYRCTGTTSPYWPQKQIITDIQM